MHSRRFEFLRERFSAEARLAALIARVTFEIEVRRAGNRRGFSARTAADLFLRERLRA